MAFGPVPSAACSLRVRDSVCHVRQASFNMTPTLVSVPGRVFVDGSRGSIDVDIRCGLDGPGFEPRQGARCLVFSKTIQTACIFIGYRDYFSVLKRREVKHSPPSVDYRNEWSCTSALYLTPCAFMALTGTILPVLTLATVGYILVL